MTLPEPQSTQDRTNPPPSPSDVSASPAKITAGEEVGKKTDPSWWENFKLAAIALVLALIIRGFVAEPRFIPSDSMVPTLRVGDRLVVEKLSYRQHVPLVGDIIVFHPPDVLLTQGYQYEQAFIKRVVGLPGQTIEVKQGKVWRDGTPLNEPYIASPPVYRMKPITVQPGMIFVMGDNRNNSNDSHVWGLLPQKNIIGRAIWRFFPFDRLGWMTRGI
jgi:signal peptidase I